MSLTDLPLSFWSYALKTIAFTLNRAPSKSVETTPYELWYGKRPKLSFLKVWECHAYVKKLQPEKLEPKAEMCIFIGYPKETVGYTFYLKSEGKVFVAKNGTFLEKEFLSRELSGRKIELTRLSNLSSLWMVAQGKGKPLSLRRRLRRKLMMMIMKLRFKFLSNHAGRRDHVLL